MRKVVSIIFLVLAILVSSCVVFSCKKWKCCSEGLFLQVYKTKADYTNNAFVFLSKDKKSVVGYLDYIDTAEFPILLDEGFYLNNMMSNNAAFLSISIEEYNANIMDYTNEDMLQMVIDNDPFLEFYSAVDNHNLYAEHYAPNIEYINQLIKDGKLKKEFKKIK